MVTNKDGITRTGENNKIETAPPHLFFVDPPSPPVRIWRGPNTTFRLD